VAITSRALGELAQLGWIGGRTLGPIPTRRFAAQAASAAPQAAISEQIACHPCLPFARRLRELPI